MVNEALSSPISSLDPIRVVNTQQVRVTTQIFDGLMRFPDGDREPAGALVTNTDLTTDYQTYTFTLDRRAQFHHGWGPVTADDVVYSFERIAASPRSRRRPFLLDELGVEHEVDGAGKYVPGSLAVETLDTHTVQITLQRPFYGALSVLTYDVFTVIPEGIVGDVPGYAGELSYEEFASRPIGAGPFQFKEWVSGDHVTVERFDRYYGETPRIDGIRWGVVPRADKRYHLVQDGRLDLWRSPQNYDPSLRSVNRVTSKGQTFGTYGPMANGQVAAFEEMPGLTTYYLGFNCQNVPRSVRRAVAYGIDQRWITQQLLGRGRPAAHLTPPGVYPGGSDAYDAHAQLYPYGLDEVDVEGARTTMEAAGYGPDNRYPLTLTMFGLPFWQSIAEKLRSDLVSAYLDISIQPISFGDLLNKGRHGDVEGFSLGWALDWPNPDNVIQLLFPPYSDITGPNPISYFDWHGTRYSEQVREDYEQVLAHPEPTDAARAIRESMYVDIEEANWEGVAAIPLYHSLRQRFHKPTVTIDPFGTNGPFVQQYTGVRLEPDAAETGAQHRPSTKR